jgi:ribonucleoside-triphosphate reductase
VGFIGLAEALKALTGTHPLGGRMRDLCDQATAAHRLNFSLLATPREGLSGKMAASWLGSMTAARMNN